MAEGTIKKLTDKGFGFIDTGADKDLFFHMSNLDGVRYEELQEGQRVTFTEGQGPKGPRAEKRHAYLTRGRFLPRDVGSQSKARRLVLVNKVVGYLARPVYWVSGCLFAADSSCFRAVARSAGRVGSRWQCASDAVRFGLADLRRPNK